MATAQAVRPMMAQTFVDSKNGVVFDMVASSSPASPRPSPARRPPPPPASPVTKRPSTSPKKHRGKAQGDGSTTDIFSLTDAMLADRYQFVKEVGFGNWGSVWQVKSKMGKTSGTTMAIKLVHRSKNPTSSARVRSLWTEFKVIRSLRDAPHPNIISFSSFVITPSYALVTMAHHPKLMPVALPESKAKGYFLQLLSALDHLHAHGCTHNDIKPANILLNAEDCPILVDFGFAQQYPVTSRDRFLSSLSWGTPEYLSVERAKGILHDERLSDIWALGVTMYEIVVGRTPFEENEEEQFLTREALEVYYARTTSGKFYGKYLISPDFEDLIQLMVKPRVSERVSSCGKALQHRFFTPPELKAKASRPTSMTASKLASTPKRSDSLANVCTPSSSAKRAPTSHRKPVTPNDRRQSFKIYEDASPISTPSRKPAATAGVASPSPTTFSPRPLVLGVRNGVYNTPSRTPGKTPSRIPIRKADISNPIPLPKVPSSRTQEESSDIRRAESPSQIRDVVSPSPPVKAPKSPARKLVKTPPKVSSDSPRSPPPATITIPTALAVVESLKQLASRDSKEVLASSSRTTSPVQEKHSILLGPQSSPSTPHDSSFASSVPSSPRSPGFFKRSQASKNVTDSARPSMSRTTSTLEFDEQIGACGRTSPVLVHKASSSLASKLRKMSLKRAPSAMSFANIKRPFSQQGRRRASTVSSVYSVVDLPRDSHNDQNPATMPLDLHARPAAEVEGDK